MKIAVVMWLINDVGGITSWNENIIKGLKAIGHKVDTFYSTHQRSLNCDPNKKVFRSPKYHLLPARHLSYTQELKRAIATLNQYDLIIFGHTGPHPIKSVVNIEGARNWQKLYTETKPPKIAVFNDPHWDRTNPWFAEVACSFDYAVGTQPWFLPSIERYCRDPKTKKFHTKHGIVKVPMLLPNTLPPIAGKKKRVVIGTQWLAIKNHRHVIPKADKIKIPLATYGNGQTYYKLREHIDKFFLRDEYQGTTGDPNSKHIHYGYVEYQKLLEGLRNSWFSIDLSTDGRTNMTHYEPLSVGTISLIENRVLHNGFTYMPPDCCIGFDIESVVDSLNSLLDIPREELLAMRERGWEFIQQCDHRRVADKLIRNATE